MASEHDPVNWIIPDGEASTTIVFLEATGNQDVYLAIYRITNNSDLDVIVRTAEGSTLTLLGQQQGAQPASIDVSSTQIILAHEGRFLRGNPLTGTYQLLCCSVGRTASFTEKLHDSKKIKRAKHGRAKRKPIGKAG